MAWSVTVHTSELEKDDTEILEGEEESNCGIESEGKYILIKQITPKIIYKLSVGSKYNPSTAREYFSRKFQIIRLDTWKSIYLLPRKVTVDTKIRMSQYKILNNILYLNRRLYLMKKVVSSLFYVRCGSRDTGTYDNPLQIL